MATTTAQIQQLYVAYLGRAADKAGLDYWFEQLNGSTTAPATLTLENLRANFVNEQPEYQNAYAGLNRTETVAKIYLQLFGHPADAAGLEYWTTGGGATVNADQLLVAFVNGASADDAKVIANKVLVSEVYTSTAGANYTAADAAAIIADVKADPATVTAALAKLSDGSLPGVAVPQGVALLKAAAVAEAAVEKDGASKVDSLKALNDKVVALNATYKIGLTDVKDGIDANNTLDYDEAVAAYQNAKDLQTAILAGKTVGQLQLDATAATAALKTAYDNLVLNSTTAKADADAYAAAVTANAKVAAVAPEQIDNVTGGLQGVIGASVANGAAFTAASDAYVAAGGSAIADADALYAAIKGANATKLAAIDKAFNTGVFAETYASVKTVAVADAAKAAAQAKEDAAALKVGGAYVSAYGDNVDATKVLADAKSVEVLVAQGKAIVDAHQAVVDSHQNAVDALDAITDPVTGYAHDESGVVAGATVVGDNTKADLFFFAGGNPTSGNDFTLTNFNKGDAIYVGEGYTLTSNVTLNADGTYTGTNANLKEVFFTQATDGTVSLNIETTAVGHAAGGSDANVAVITLTGVTSLADVSFSNGIIVSNHVAA